MAHVHTQSALARRRSQHSWAPACSHSCSSPPRRRNPRPSRPSCASSTPTVRPSPSRRSTPAPSRSRPIPRPSASAPAAAAPATRSKLDSANALGLLADGGIASRKLKPLSVSDSFDFGLALCGIGKAVAPDTGFWYLKQNHAASTTGGDQTLIKRGDDILWYLIEDFNDPIPDELVLKAPPRVKSGESVTVKVVSYADDGKRTPAEGAEVTGADEPTDGKGKTTLTADEDILGLTATRKGSIPSNTEVLCTLVAARCPAGFAATIGGTNGDDKIVAGAEAEVILAGRGDDRIDASKGASPDVIKCGGGEDKLILTKRQKHGKNGSCERIIRR